MFFLETVKTKATKAQSRDCYPVWMQLRYCRAMGLVDPVLLRIGTSRVGWPRLN